MKTLKVVFLSLVTIASLGGGYGLSKFVFPNYVGENKVLWETVRVNSKNGSKQCQLLEKPEKEVDISSFIQKVISSHNSQEFSNSCSTYWANNIIGSTDINKAVEGTNTGSDDVAKQQHQTELWIRGQGKDNFNKLLSNEPLGDVIGLEKLIEEIDKESSPNPKPNDKTPSSNTNPKSIDIEKLKSYCEVKEENNWITVKCPKNSSLTSKQQ
ncbi:hypothetical protein, rapamycin associated [Mycoplasma suis KI3806]|uniref:Uncharacterized protein n=1 Tax=Mycoplasma suis (strain KI_3806) TaxID=708248 RepID=F0V246_MYCS3|nr:hypothetical protein [Mycoplasma suis]CBZ40727.1 hypothetical protein, rapamycin associated [Mycoplasma suis KI3806]